MLCNGVMRVTQKKLKRRQFLFDAEVKGGDGALLKFKPVSRKEARLGMRNSGRPRPGIFVCSSPWAACVKTRR